MTGIDIHKIWNKILHSKKADTYCFLCGVELTSSNKSIEHVIPKWLQRKYDLWNQHIVLINGTSIPYKNLTIPCCKDCNNHYLKQIESKVHKAALSGFVEVKKLDQLTLFQWIGKIFYGLMYKELFLKYNQQVTDSDAILSPEILDDYQTHYIFLQSCRQLVDFNEFSPFTILVVNLQSSKEQIKNWDFTDNLQCMCIAIRMGDTGIIGMLQDSQQLRDFSKMYPQFFQHPLHPIQFRELIALVFYWNSLINRTPKYIIGDENGVLKIHQLPLGGLSNRPIFDKFNYKDYGHFLSHLTGLPEEQVNPQEGLVWTFMQDQDGNPLFLDIHDNIF